MINSLSPGLEGSDVTKFCPICSGVDSVLLAERAETPVFQNALFANSKEAQDCTTGQLEMRHCISCGFAWNSAFDPKLIDYGTDYDNNNSLSTAFQAHLADRIEKIAAATPNKPLELLEIGCGQGDFLAQLVERLGTVQRAVGFDPACRATRKKEDIELHAAYFDLDAMQIHGLMPDVVISRHTIEHIPQPIAFLSMLRTGLPEARPVQLFLETPTNDWILNKQAYHDLFYEHCSLFSPTSLSIALERAGFRPTELSLCFGGQYLWVEALNASPTAVTTFQDAGANYIAHWRAFAEAAHSAGSVFIWGAGAKGATFAQLIDPEARLFDAVIDINPNKQGKFIGATGHPIRAPKSLAESTAQTTILVMNSLYIDEIRKELARMKRTSDIHCVD